MGFKIVILWTDALIYLLVVLVGIFFVWSKRYPHLRKPWANVMKRRIAVASMVIMIFYVLIALLDSIHYQVELPSTQKDQQVHYSPEVYSLLDKIYAPLGEHHEKTYSAPFASHLFVLRTKILENGKTVRVYPKLKYGSANIEGTQNRLLNIILLSLQAFVVALICWLLFSFVFIAIVSFKKKIPYKEFLKDITQARTLVAWRTFFITFLFMLSIIFITYTLSQHYHILGTDKVGKDVFFQSLESIRTGLVIGTLTTLVMLPFAVLLGCMAGYFGGIVDDIIQYIYTTLSSIPAVLLIVAAILSLQIYMTNHAELFTNLAQRADIRLLALCLILGVTSWTGLCRMLRGETLKLREVDYIQAARAMGVKDFSIILRHIIPNVMHIILIAMVLDFSGLVLAEAVLSYVGVGVDPTTNSWGNMINAARLQFAREPVVWWPLLSAFVLMFVLVLSANLFSDAVRDAFDPRIQQSA